MFKALNNRALIRPDEPEKETASGIILVENQKEKPMTGVVVYGNSVVHAEDHVLFSRYGLDEFSLDGETMCVVSADAILGIF